jgi:hypothetical protein
MERGGCGLFLELAKWVLIIFLVIGAIHLILKYW